MASSSHSASRWSQWRRPAPSNCQSLALSIPIISDSEESVGEDGFETAGDSEFEESEIASHSDESDGNEERFVNPQSGMLSPKERFIWDNISFHKRFLLHSFSAKRGITLEQLLEEMSSCLNAFISMPDHEMENFLHHAVPGHIPAHQMQREEREGEWRWEYSLTIDLRYGCAIETYNVPTSVRGRTPLHRALGDDRVLDVRLIFDRPKFRKSKKSKKYLQHLLKEGRTVGGRLFKLWGFKKRDEKLYGRETRGSGGDGKNEEERGEWKVVFVCVSSAAEFDKRNGFLLYETMLEAWTSMAHFHTLTSIATMAKRLKHTMSDTYAVDFESAGININEDVRFVLIHDIKAEGAGKGKEIMTDGCGFMSTDIAKLCRGEGEDYALQRQIRGFHYGNLIKGMLVKNDQLPPMTIQYRKSMHKVAEDTSDPLPDFLPRAYNSLEVCQKSVKPSKDTRMYRHLILLLLHGGVPKSFFLSCLDTAIEERVMPLLNDRKQAIKDLKKRMEWDASVELPLRMLLAGVSMRDAYLERTLWNLYKSELKKLGEGKIPLPRSFYLKGTALPEELRGQLQPHQIVVILDGHMLIRRRLLVFKPPGIHFGDVRVMEAVYLPVLERFVGPISEVRYGLFFSIDGDRSPAAMMSGGSDYDGDAYLIIDEPQIVNSFTKPSPVWVPHVKKPRAPLRQNPSQLDPQGYEDCIAKELLDSVYSQSHLQVGSLNNEWLAWADLIMDPTANLSASQRAQGLSNMDHIADCYYLALDASPTDPRIPVDRSRFPQEWPDYLEEERGRKNRGGSESSSSRQSKSTQETASQGTAQSDCGSSESRSHGVRESGSVLKLIYDRVRDLSPAHDLDLWVPQDVEVDPDFLSSCGDYERHKKTWERRFRDYKWSVKNACDDQSLERKNEKIRGAEARAKKDLYGAENLTSSVKPRKELLEEACSIYVMVYSSLQETRREHGVDAKLSGLQFPWVVAGHALCIVKATKSSNGDHVALSTSVLTL